MLHEVGVAGEVVVLAMLEDKHAFRLQQVALEDEARNLGQLLQGIGWIGEDEIKLLFARLDKAERITPDTLLA